MDRKTALKTISENVSRIIESSGVGVRELARNADVDPMVVSRLVNGTSLPGVDAVYRIAAALDVSVDTLLAKEPSKQSSNKEEKSSKKSA